MLQPFLLFNWENSSDPLKRDVAYFHADAIGDKVNTDRVSIAQARCGLLPRRECMSRTYIETVFQSLKRDVAYFHLIRIALPLPFYVRFNRSSAMWPTSTPPAPPVTVQFAPFQSLKRDVAYFHSITCSSLPAPL